MYSIFIEGKLMFKVNNFTRAMDMILKLENVDGVRAHIEDDLDYPYYSDLSGGGFYRFPELRQLVKDKCISIEGVNHEWGVNVEVLKKLGIESIYMNKLA